MKLIIKILNKQKNAMYIRNKSPKSLDKPLKVSKISSNQAINEVIQQK